MKFSNTWYTKAELAVSSRVGGSNPLFSYMAYRDTFAITPFVPLNKYRTVTEFVNKYSLKLTGLGLQPEEFFSNDFGVDTPFRAGDTMYPSFKAIEFFMEPVNLLEHGSVESGDEKVEPNEFTDDELDSEVISLMCSAIISAPESNSLPTNGFYPDILKFILTNYQEDELEFKIKLFDAMLCKAKMLYGGNFSTKCFATVFSDCWINYFCKAQSDSFTSHFGKEYMREMKKVIRSANIPCKVLKDVKVSISPLEVSYNRYADSMENKSCGVAFLQGSETYEFKYSCRAGKYLLNCDDKELPIKKIKNIAGISKLILADNTLLIQLIFKVRRHDMLQSIIVDCDGVPYNESTKAVMQNLGIKIKLSLADFPQQRHFVPDKFGNKLLDGKLIAFDEYYFTPYQF